MYVAFILVLSTVCPICHGCCANAMRGRLNRYTNLNYTQKRQYNSKLSAVYFANGTNLFKSLSQERKLHHYLHLTYVSSVCIDFLRIFTRFAINHSTECLFVGSTHSLNRHIWRYFRNSTITAINRGNENR